MAIPFLDVIWSELKSRFSKEKRAHYELCALIPQVITSKSEEATVEVGQVLHEKWGHLMPLPSSFESELFRWMNHWKRQAASDYESISVSAISETCRRHLLPKREGISKSSRHSAYGEHGGGEVIFLYSEDPYLASQHNDHRTTLRFGCHRHACKYSYHR